ncbi:MAG TPA: ABC transporter substrate-binding protein [Bryobacteraceae bacterium]|nr:ABC transporter substrate-binding protein [Bryobacteraceae bacterium]
MRRRLFGVVLLSAWAPGGGAPPQMGALPPILIGVSNVQSGPSRSLGQELMRGSLSYFEAINQRGGVYGRKIAVVLKDDKYEPEPAVENTNELITKDKVLFLFDYVGTPTLTRVLPLLRFYEDQNVVNIAPFTGADPQRTPPYSKYVFNIRASYREETRGLVDYFYKKGFRKIGFLGQSDAYGKSGQVGVAEALEERGLKIVGSVAYRRNSPFSASMRAQVDLLRKEGADAVIAVGAYSACGAFIRDARLAGWNVPIANVSFVNAQAMLDLLRAGSKTAGMDLTVNLINSQVVPFPNDTRWPLVKAYGAQLPAAQRGFTSLEGWLNAAVVSEALKRAGPNPSRETFIKAMESLGGWDPGIGYKLEFSHTGHQGLHKVWLTKMEHAEWVPELAPGETP